LQSTSTLLLIFAAGLAGFSKGFAAFGTALVYIPMVTLAYDVRTAVVTLFLVDLLPSVPVVYAAADKADKRVIFFMGLGALIGSPVGIAALSYAEPAALRKCVGALILLAAVYFLLKPSFRVPNRPLFAAVSGTISGVLGGAAGLYGPPALIYLLSIGLDAARTRASMFLFLAVQSCILGAIYLFTGMMRIEDVYIAGIALPSYAIGLWVGAHGFRGVDDTFFKRTLLALLISISVVLFFS
jgi:uncharacterized membrane protein YfcA